PVRPIAPDLTDKSGLFVGPTESLSHLLPQNVFDLVGRIQAPPVDPGFARPVADRVEYVLADIRVFVIKLRQILNIPPGGITRVMLNADGIRSDRIPILIDGTLLIGQKVFEGDEVDPRVVEYPVQHDPEV